MLSKGHRILEIHIPAGGKMDYTLCKESFHKAYGFFPLYFPDKPFVAFTCRSWLLDPNLQQLLPSSSNIIKFQCEFYRYPVLADAHQTFERVFGSDPFVLTSAPRDTILQRAIVDHIMAVGHVHSGAGFILNGNS